MWLVHRSGRSNHDSINTSMQESNARRRTSYQVYKAYSSCKSSSVPYTGTYHWDVRGPTLRLAIPPGYQATSSRRVNLYAVHNGPFRKGARRYARSPSTRTFVRSNTSSARIDGDTVKPMPLTLSLALLYIAFELIVLFLLYVLCGL